MRRSALGSCPFRPVTLTPPTKQCSIALWHGYVKAQFYVRARDDDRALGFSETFRTWRLPWEERRSMKDDPSALAALAAFEADLLANGWKRIRRAPHSDWYELRFRRTVRAPNVAEALAPVARRPRRPPGSPPFLRSGETQLTRASPHSSP